MSSVEAENAKMRERARIREEVVKLPTVENAHIFGGATLVPLSRVLKAINHDLPEDRPEHGAD